MSRNGGIVIVAERPIEPGEEITYSYGKEYLEYFLSNGGCRCAACRAKAARRRRKARLARAAKASAKNAPQEESSPRLTPRYSAAICAASALSFGLSLQASSQLSTLSDLTNLPTPSTWDGQFAGFLSHTLLSWKAAPPNGATGSAPVSVLMPRPSA